MYLNDISSIVSQELTDVGVAIIFGELRRLIDLTTFIFVYIIKI